MYSSSLIIVANLHEILKKKHKNTGMSGKRFQHIQNRETTQKFRRKCFGTEANGSLNTFQSGMEKSNT
jgi:hypothetical protein